MKTVTKSLFFVLLSIFLGTMFLGLFQMSPGMNMSMEGGMPDCPFMSHEEVVCPMNFIDHISAWKDVFLAVSPTLTLLMGMVVMVGLIISIAPNLLVRKQFKLLILQRQILESTYSFVQRPLQELFSNGVLHPKLF